MGIGKQDKKINKITVKGVIEKYDYTIDFTSGSSDLKAVYVENGHGKTNLLKLLDYLTSENQSKFRRIFTIPFKEVCIETTVGKITCFKESKKSCKICTKKSDELDDLSLNITFSELEEEFDIDEDLSENSKDTYKKYLFIVNSIESIVGDVKFLGINRLNDIRSSVTLDRGVRPLIHEEISLDNSDYILQKALENLSNALIRRVQRASAFSNGRRGSYAQIVTSLLDDDDQGTQNKIAAKEAMEEKISKIKNNMELFRKYDVISFNEFSSIADKIKKTQKDDERLKDVAKILIPYFDSLEERIQVMLPTVTLLDNFINTVNKMFSGVEIKYNIRHIRSNFDFVHKIGNNKVNNFSNIISPGSLSSGEQHLLLLFAQVIMSSTRGDTLLLIDEPEISLGIPWQKVLVKYIKEFSKDSSLQIIMATHSPILLYDYADEDVIMSDRICVDQKEMNLW